MSELALLTGADTKGSKLYVDDVFSAYTYTGNGSTQTITNGIDLAGKGGMVWTKQRNGVDTHSVQDTVIGTTKTLCTASSGAAPINSTCVSAFNSSGYSVGSYWDVNTADKNYVSWTFRKAPKFFDVVTYTGNGVASRMLSHSLGGSVGMLIIKATSTTGDWYVLHQSVIGDLYLNTTAAKTASNINWASSTQIEVNGVQNTNGVTYVAYLFAHDTSADGIIQCGSFTTDGSGNATVNLGWEPQYVMVKSSSINTTGWEIYDQMRGWNAIGGNRNKIEANATAAESVYGQGLVAAYPTANGFTYAVNLGGYQNTTFIYLAIRRPNKPPTLGTQVYNAIARAGTGAVATVTGVGFAPDLVISGKRTGAATGSAWFDRLRGSLNVLQSYAVSAESTTVGTITSFDMDGETLGNDTAGYINKVGPTYVNHFFKRSPGVFDQVCYTGTGAVLAVPHSLGTAPELLLCKSRSSSADWSVYSNAVGATHRLLLSNSDAPTVNGSWNNIDPTSSVFTVTGAATVGSVGVTYVAYLFATKAGISKVGTYTGNGSSQTINCGFTSGARFILIKRTDSAGDWFTWDTARGIVAGTDPHLSLNSSAVEVTTDDSIDPDTSGFIVNQVAATNINVTSATYIFLAIA